MVEQDVMRLTMITLSKIREIRIFRNNTGIGWTGKIKRLPNTTTIMIENPRPLHAGLCVGSSDLIGWKTLKITKEMVGKEVAIFTAIEVKTKKGKPSPEQINFIETVKNSGGYAGIATNDNEALDLLK